MNQPLIDKINEALNERVHIEVEKRCHDWLEKANGTDWTQRFELALSRANNLQTKLDEWKDAHEKQKHYIIELEADRRALFEANETLREKIGALERGQEDLQIAVDFLKRTGGKYSSEGKQ